MSNWGKILGGGLGWTFGGPLGALVGLAIGEYMVDSPTRQAKKSGAKAAAQRARNPQTQAGDFGVALLALSAAVVNADGKVLKSEIQFVRKFFTQSFGQQKANQYIKLFQEILKQEIKLREICIQIRNNMDHAMRLELVRYLFELSNSDGEVHPKEIEIIKKISYYLGVSEKDYVSLKNIYFESANASYKILEINKSASVAEIKKAYRKMALKYHPDRLAELGPELQENAKKKFQAVQDAYEKIKKEKGFK